LQRDAEFPGFVDRAENVPTELFGIPIYLVAAILFLLVAAAIGLLRGGTSERGEARARSAAFRLDLQTISAILGIVSFALQILQWLKIIG
jgi:hypothetical protein